MWPLTLATQNKLLLRLCPRTSGHALRGAVLKLVMCASPPRTRAPRGQIPSLSLPGIPCPAQHQARHPSSGCFSVLSTGSCLPPCGVQVTSRDAEAEYPSQSTACSQAAGRSDSKLLAPDLFLPGPLPTQSLPGYPRVISRGSRDIPLPSCSQAEGAPQRDLQVLWLPSGPSSQQEYQAEKGQWPG